MKKRIPTRVASAFLAIVTIILALPLSTIMTFAEEATFINISTSAKYQTEYRIHNNYTAIYNVFNKAEQKNKWQNFTSGVGKAKGIVGTTGNLAVNLYTSIAGWDNSKAWYENAGEAVLSLACAYVGISLPGPSESDKTIEAVGQMIDGIHDHLTEMENNIIKEISTVVRDSDTDLAEFIANENIKYDLKAYLKDFDQGAVFSYKAFKSNLNRDISYLQRMIEEYDNAIANNLSSQKIDERKSQVQEAYDNLYKTLTANDNGAQISPIEKFRDFMQVGYKSVYNGEDCYSSIPRILYAYQVVKAANNGGSVGGLDISTSCIDYALELYYTYLLAEQSINACYAYQLSDMQSRDSTEYNGKDVKVTDVQIEEGIEAVFSAQEGATKKLVEDIAYFLNLDSTYAYETGDRGTVYNISYIDKVDKDSFFAVNNPSYYGSFIKDNWYRINNRVISGDVIYMNTMPDMFKEMFKEGVFTFQVEQCDSNGNAVKESSTVSDTGMVKILGKTGDKITVSLYYDDILLYSMEFDIVDRVYSGGMGIENCPYFISTKEDFEKIVGEKNQITGQTNNGVYFQLVNDINYADASISTLGDFYGILDGNGYSVYGFTVSCTSETALGITIMKENALGLFQEVKENAVIKNLIIGSEDHTTAIKIDGHRSTGAQCGALAVKNLGTISNCKIVKTDVLAYVNTSNDNERKYSKAGGLVAINEGKIEYCGVIDSSICAKSYSQDDGTWGNHCNAEAIAGGVVGVNYGNMFGCYSYGNTIKADTEANSCGTDDAYGYSYTGGIIGEHKSEGTVDYLITNDQNTLISTGSTNGNWMPFAGSGDADIYKIEDPIIAKNKPDNVKSIFLTDGKTLNDLKKRDSYSWLSPSLNYYIFKETYENRYKSICENVDSFLEYFYDTETYPLPNASKAPEIVIEVPCKALFYVNELLNPCGMIIKDSKCNAVNGYMISGFDSSQAGDRQLTVSYTTGYGTATASIDISVVDNEAEELVMFSKPTKTVYTTHDNKLDINGLMLLVRYSDGTSKILDENNGAIEYSITPINFSALGKTTVEFGYEGLTANMDIDIVCGHENTVDIDAVAPSCNQVGYTAGVFCSDCHTYISGHAEIPAGGEHQFEAWKKYDENQHIRTCECGKTEYAAHSRSSGTATTPTTSGNNGVITYTCTACGATCTHLDHIPGDITGDGKLNNKDLSLLFQYLSGWNVTVNVAALDVNGDGKVNNKDLSLLFQYLSGWDVEIH